MATIKAASAQALPGAGLDFAKMPGHWILAQMGKRVLRPGGLELTQKMLGRLDINEKDDVVEFAPGLGVTARLTLSKSPASYTGVERDPAAAAQVEGYLHGPSQRCVLGRGEETGLADESASVLYGEALLTMQTQKSKEHIVAEAYRVLRPGGRYGIHEIAITPETIDAETRQELEHDLQTTIRVGARPLTAPEWRKMLEDAGFEVYSTITVPMALLEPQRLLADEGVLGVARIMANLARHPVARQRVLAMRKAFTKHAANMSAISLVAVKR